MSTETVTKCNGCGVDLPLGGNLQECTTISHQTLTGEVTQFHACKVNHCEDKVFVGFMPDYAAERDAARQEAERIEREQAAAMAQAQIEAEEAARAEEAAQQQGTATTNE